MDARKTQMNLLHLRMKIELCEGGLSSLSIVEKRLLCIRWLVLMDIGCWRQTVIPYHSAASSCPMKYFCLKTHQNLTTCTIFEGNVSIYKYSHVYALYKYADKMLMMSLKQCTVIGRL